MPSLTVDGRRVEVRPGRTILEACRELGVAVPTLCQLDGVTPAGSCRLCLVEVAGLPRPVPACSTPALAGMRVATDTASLRSHRRSVVELLLSSGEHACGACPASGRCELQALARDLGVDHFTPREGRRAARVDLSRRRFALDRARCVLCTRCVRACAELERAGSLLLVGRGARTRIASDGGARWADSPTCTDCGRCAAACPTGALVDALAGEPRAPSPSSAAAPGASTPRAPGRKVRVATAWLGGCSGCHMALLDLDEGLLALAGRFELVYSPLADAKRYPGDVDLCLVEGAVAVEEQADLLRRIRARTRVVVALGDCAASGNVTALRDGRGGAAAVLRRAWGARATAPRHPALPALCDPVLPLHEVVAVDLFLGGCPPSPGAIGALLEDVAAGRRPAPGAGPEARPA